MQQEQHGVSPMSHKDGDQTTIKDGMANNSPWGVDRERQPVVRPAEAADILFSCLVSIVRTVKYNIEVAGMCTGHPLNSETVKNPSLQCENNRTILFNSYCFG